MCAEFHLCQACFNTPVHSEHGFQYREVRNQMLFGDEFLALGIQRSFEATWKCNCVFCHLNHPSLGWLYVFSSFPPPHPPPQQLLPLTSKSFELNLRYLVQRIYGSGEMYWMTFPWPWPKVTAVASISKNLLVCTIKWEPLIISLQNMAALLP